MIPIVIIALLAGHLEVGSASIGDIQHKFCVAGCFPSFGEGSLDDCKCENSDHWNTDQDLELPWPCAMRGDISCFCGYITISEGYICDDYQEHECENGYQYIECRTCHYYSTGCGMPHRPSCNNGTCVDVPEEGQLGSYRCACDERYTGQHCEDQIIDCVGSWSSSGECSATCGNGTITETYSISTVAENGGHECPAEDGDTQDVHCNEGECPGYSDLPGWEWKQYNGVEYAVSPWNNLPDPHTGDVHNFTTARQLCQDQGGDLASIPDESTWIWLKDNVLPFYPSGYCVPYMFWCGLIKPLGDACSSQGCLNFFIGSTLDATLCDDCRTGWLWIDGSSYTSWNQDNWHGHMPREGHRHGLLSGCSLISSEQYKWSSQEDDQLHRLLCCRAIN